MTQVVVYLALLACSAAASDNLYELNIIHYNDFHAHFDEISPSGGVCQPEVETCIGGFARLYTAIKQAKEAEPDSLLLNGGDTFQGTVWYNFLRWNVSYNFMNLLDHDAHVLGNHEFDHGIDGLLPYLERLNAPMLGANVNTELEPEMTPYVKNHVIVNRKGRRIGIIGVLLQQFSAPIGNVKMEDELEAINREAAILTADGVDIIVVLSHVGYTSDIWLAERVSPTVDVIVGGHSHTLLYTGPTPNGDTALGEYPTVVTQANGHRIPIVQASCYTRYLGNIKLFINAQGIVERWQGEPVFLGSSIVQDEGMLKILDEWRIEVDAKGKEVLGESRVSLSRSRCSMDECNLGSWACDGFLDEMVRYAKGPNWNHAHLCLINTGGLRTQILPGNVTTEALLMALPFENSVQVYELEGRYLQEALEFSVGVNWSDSFNSGRMLQIGGMRVIINASNPIGSRVTATIRCIDCDVPRYLPLDPDATYRVLSQNYIGDGGGGYSMISDNRKNLETFPDLDYMMLQNYMRRQGVIIKGLDGRIQVVY
nr:apyrase [Spodoptera frugiperda]